MGFIEELTWRGMLHDITPGLHEQLTKPPVGGYAGFDPTASSLQVGNLVPIMLLVHFQRAGHKPIALVGGATGMIGDPSGKSEERNLLSIEEIEFNQQCIKNQLSHFLDFESKINGAEIVNNYQWFGEVKFLEFLRDVGKHLTVSYMLAKDSVQQRLETGLSFTEFTYQLLQGYDFYWLRQNKNCLLQIGGSDQWGNITAGTELIRRKSGLNAYALTCPLLTKEDGTKFGKSAAGEKLWLDPSLTSPYKFYQFWLNCSDEEARKCVRVFTLLNQEEIADLESKHAKEPHLRHLHKALAREITVRVHSQTDYENAIEASKILFGQGTAESLTRLPEKNFLEVFEGIPRMRIDKTILENGINVLTLLTEKAPVFASKGEAKRMIGNKGLQINQIKVNTQDDQITQQNLLNGKYVLVQKGKKNYFILEVR